MRSYGKEKKSGVVYVLMASCFFFFIIGFFLFSLLSQGNISEISTRRSVNEEINTQDHGETGFGSVYNIPFQVLSWNPRIFYLPNFATKEQCKAMIDMAKPKLKPSRVAVRKGQMEEDFRNQSARTSTGVFIDADEDESGLIATIEEKIAIATKIPRTHHESFNILRYQLRQKYDSHYDAFDPALYGPVKNQRVISFLLYLSNVEEGGETTFPFENGKNMNPSFDYKKCIGLKVKPRQGDAIFFYSLFPNGTIDPTSMHGSCPVIKGEKWVATKWITNQIYE